MGYRASIQFGGGKARREHNIRNPKVVDKQEHIDTSRPHEIWMDETELQAYERLFGESIREYNEHQKRTDRLQSVQKYYKQIEENPKLHTSYEVIAQVGRKDNPVPPEVAKSILKEFAETWKHEYPGMALFGLYYHEDEIGVGHLHADFIPVAHGYSTGIKTRMGLNRALFEQFGFQTYSTQKTVNGKTRIVKVTPEQQFQQLLRDKLIEVSRKHGLDMEETRHDIDDPHREMWDVRQQLEQANVDADAIRQSARQDAHKEGQQILENYETSGKQIYEESLASAKSWGDIAKQRKAAADEEEKRLQETQKATESASERLGQLGSAIQQANADLSQKQTDLQEADADLQQKRQESANINTIRNAVTKVDADLVKYGQILRESSWRPETEQVIQEKRTFSGKVKPAQVVLDQDEYNKLLLRGAAAENIKKAEELRTALRLDVRDAADAVDVEKQVAIRTQQLQSQIDVLQNEKESQAAEINDQEIQIAKLQKAIKSKNEKIENLQSYEQITTRFFSQDLIDQMNALIEIERVMEDARLVDTGRFQKMGAAERTTHFYSSGSTFGTYVNWDGQEYLIRDFTAKIYKPALDQLGVGPSEQLGEYTTEQLEKATAAAKNRSQNHHKSGPSR